MGRPLSSTMFLAARATAATSSTSNSGEGDAAELGMGAGPGYSGQMCSGGQWALLQGDTSTLSGRLHYRATTGE